MTTARFTVFAGALAAGVALAVSTIGAQAPAPEPRPESRAHVMMLDGRGGQIGVMVSDLPAAEAARAGSSGVRLDEVEADGPAAKAGLRDGDIVVAFDGERVRSARQFARLVQETPDGRSVAIDYLRDGSKQTAQVTPEAHAFTWTFDGGRVERDVERALRNAEPQLRAIEPRLRERLRDIEPELRGFRIEPPGFDFHVERAWPGFGSPRGRLGIQGETLTTQLAAYFGAKDGGVLVSSVTEDSPAAKAGIRAGDVITSVNGQPIRRFDDVVDRLREAEDGAVTIGIVRDKRDQTITATLEAPERPRVRRPAP